MYIYYSYVSKCKDTSNIFYHQIFLFFFLLMSYKIDLAERIGTNSLTLGLHKGPD